MILIIDANQAIHRSFHRMELSFNEQDTEVIFGVLNHIYKLVNKFKPENIIFCWDSKRNKRKEIN
ncbi:unnamed protein product, partial [marine sediment metagenome]